MPRDREYVEEGGVEQIFLRPQSSAARRLLGEDDHIAQLKQYLGDRNLHAESAFLRSNCWAKRSTPAVVRGSACDGSRPTLSSRGDWPTANRLMESSMLKHEVARRSLRGPPRACRERRVVSQNYCFSDDASVFRDSEVPSGSLSRSGAVGKGLARAGYARRSRCGRRGWRG